MVYWLFKLINLYIIIITNKKQFLIKAYIKILIISKKIKKI